jgi:hypothetical protein
MTVFHSLLCAVMARVKFNINLVIITNPLFSFHIHGNASAVSAGKIEAQLT